MLVKLIFFFTNIDVCMYILGVVDYFFVTEVYVNHKFPDYLPSCHYCMRDLAKCTSLVPGLV